MLAMRPKGPSYNDEILSQSQAGSIAHPREPIRIILARDEELGLHSEAGSAEEDKDIALPPPPPAYGLWRCSVRADPNLIHWQRAEHAVIEEEAPSLSRSESTRPPSYHSHHQGYSEEVERPQQALVRIERDPWESYAQQMGAEPQRYA